MDDLVHNLHIIAFFSDTPNAPRYGVAGVFGGELVGLILSEVSDDGKTMTGVRLWATHGEAYEALAKMETGHDFVLDAFE